MTHLLGRRVLQEFKTIFPFWAPRVSKWRPSGLFSVKIWLTDNNIFVFSYNGRNSKLVCMADGKMKGRTVYESKRDSRKGV